jgi:putative NADPH-quinone reductase
MKIAIIQGHPDSRGRHFCNALAAAYAEGAGSAGHELRLIDVARQPFELLRSKEEFENNVAPLSLKDAQEAISWAEHLVIVYPLWLGSMPAILKGFFEQVLRPGFAFGQAGGGAGEMSGGRWKKLLKGRSARIVVTMGMPAFVYRWYFGAHGLKSLERNILAFVGIRPVRVSLVGMVEQNESRRRAWLERVRRLGTQAR